MTQSLSRRIAARAAALLTACAVVAPQTAAAENVVVAVSQIVEHPALDACREGLLAGLNDAGFREGENLTFKFQTAQGQLAIAAQIARQFVGENPDVLVGIATPSAQALAAAAKDIPVIFTAVTDPVGAKLVASMENPGGNVTGLSDLSPVGQHVDIIREMLPAAKTIGVVYNPGEANSVSLVDLLKEAAAARGMKVVEGAATKSVEVGQAAQIVAAKSDVIYGLTDNTVASAINALVDGANDSKTPVFAAETSYVDAGAVVAVGFDYHQIGRQTAEFVVRVLRGEHPGQIPARVAKGTDIVVNLGVAEKLGVTLPASLVANASRVVE